MILRSSPLSPFGRKVKVAAGILGMSDRIEVFAADTTDPTDDLREQNPLGKIPILIDDAGEAFYDSRVIVEYLDELAGGGRLIPKGAARFPVLRLQALADGLVDACILIVYESRFRDPTRHEPKWLEYQSGKIARALDHLEALVGGLGDARDIGAIALACAIGYLDLRFEGAYRQTHPKLAAFVDRFEAEVPVFAKTKVTA
ncbi:MAG: glutathione S-transferase family protein [Salinarimonadaceae bacterium]|nr:MAG: glutathione S-transferase family protein [Salinarimonadaceae bacterium]